MKDEGVKSRPPSAAGSGTGEPNPAANSHVGSEAMSNRSGVAHRPVWHGAAEGAPRPGSECGSIPRRSPEVAKPDSFVTPIAGGELHVIEAGRRMAVQIRTGRGLRNRLTASMAPDEAELWFRRGLELTINNRLARAQRDSKGA